MSGMGGLVGREVKGCGSIGCWRHYATLKFVLIQDIDLGFPRLNVEIAIFQEWESRLAWNEEDMTMLDALCALELWPHPWPWPWLFNVKFWNTHISAMGRVIGMEGIWIDRIMDRYITLNFDLGFSRSNFEIAASQEWEGWLAWNKRNVNLLDVWPTM